MAGNYAQLLDIINNPTNHSLPAWDNNAKQIEGETIQQYLLYLIQSLTVGYQFMGVASTDTSGGTPDQNVFYIAGAGTYNGFGSTPITIDGGYIGIIRWNGAWSSEPIKIADVVIVSHNAETGKEELKIGDDVKWTLDNMLKLGDDSIIRNGSVAYAMGYEGNIIVSVTQGEDLNEVMPYFLPKGEYTFILDSDLIDNNGVNITLLTSDETILLNTTINNHVKYNFTIEDDCTTLRISRYSTGIIGTGDVSVQIAPVNGIKQQIEQIVSNVEYNSLMLENIGANELKNISVQQGVDLLEYIPLKCKEGTDILIISDLENASLVNNSGVVNVGFYNGDTLVYTTTLTAGNILAYTTQTDISKISINRYGTGIIGTGTLKYSILFGTIYDLYKKIDILSAQLGIYQQITMPVTQSTALDYHSNLYIPKGDYKIRFNSPLVDNNGFTIHFYNKNGNQIQSFIMNNGTLNEFTLNSDCHSIWCERSLSGIIGTGNVIINLESATGNIPQLFNIVKSGVGYVSTTGDDDNDGTSITNAVATINKALELGFTTILIDGGTYYQKIDLSKANGKRVVISSMSNSRVVFYPQNEDDYLLGTTETKVSGYEKLYTLDYGIKTINSGISWLFQDNIPDTNTLISDAERHPLQRGQEYRLDSTKILKCTAENLADAINEIESYEGYKWFNDSANHLIYYSRPSAVNSINPICRPIPENSFIISEGGSIELIAIEVRYMALRLYKMISPRVSCCSVKYSSDWGGISWFGSKQVLLEKCESAATQYGVNGDGFNASAYGGTHLSFNASVRLVDCWSHDNNDDGYSCHQKCEGAIQGGLFEYNVKGGVTPAYGEHHQCYNVISRKNVRGFYYTGTADDGGKYGQLICFNCIAQDNSYAGFMCDGIGNKITAINCKSINDARGYITPNEDTLIELIDCNAIGNAIVKSGNININNTSLVQ